MRQVVLFVLLCFLSAPLFSACKARRVNSEVKELSLLSDRFDGWFEKVPLWIMVYDEEGKPTQTEQQFNAALARLRSEVSTFQNTSRNISDPWVITDDGSVLKEARDDIEVQIQYGLHGLQSQGMQAQYKKMQLYNLEVPEQSFNGNDPFLTGYTKILWTGRVPLQVDKEQVARTKTSAAVLLPRASSASFRSALMKRYAPCVNKTLVGVGNEANVTTEDNFFYYFDEKSCAFETREAEYPMFARQTLKITPQAGVGTGAATASPAPEYDRIWENDGTMVATIFFGLAHPNSPDVEKDPGTIAFHDFVNWVEKSRSTTFVVKSSNVGFSSSNIHYKIEYRNSQYGKLPNGQWKRLDLQVVHLPGIQDIGNQAVAKVLLGDRIDRHDFFMYNGHAGYGTNVAHIENLIKPQKDQYVLFHINGCYTYAYNSIDNPNFDVITNVNAGDFYDMSQISIAMITGLLHGDDYQALLAHIPADHHGVVLGEDVKSCKK